jgi:hypothetical protein
MAHELVLSCPANRSLSLADSQPMVRPVGRVGGIHAAPSWSTRFVPDYRFAVRTGKRPLFLFPRSPLTVSTQRNERLRVTTETMDFRR